MIAYKNLAFPFTAYVLPVNSAGPHAMIRLNACSRTSFLS